MTRTATCSRCTRDFEHAGKGRAPLRRWQTTPKGKASPETVTDDARDELLRICRGMRRALGE